eukprot:791561-Amphidinium_carterae.1
MQVTRKFWHTAPHQHQLQIVRLAGWKLAVLCKLVRGKLVVSTLLLHVPFHPVDGTKFACGFLSRVLESEATHVRTYARTHTRTKARTHAHTHTHTHILQALQCRRHTAQDKGQLTLL